MEIQNQNNQSSEALNNNVQNEKSAVVAKEADFLVVSQQISKDEKASIISLISGKGIMFNDSLPEKSLQNAGVISPEKEDIDIKNVPKQEITSTEKKFILSLLRDTIQDKKIENKLLEQEEINYENLNKQELVEFLEDIVEEKDIAIIKDTVAKIKVEFYKKNKEDVEKAKQHFISEGGDEKDFAHIEDPLEHRFKIAFAHYKHNKAKHAEEIEKEKQLNLQKKLEILEELKQLINSEETLKKTYDEFRNLQEQWKEIGLIPASELNNLWQNYHFLVEKFFDKVRINRELRDLDMKKNMEAKIALCEKTEDLLMEDSIIKSFKLLQKYHDEWREIGPVPSDKKDALWERFKAATDKINERRREHYKELQEEQEKNFEAKKALCEKAEDIINEKYETLKDWQNGTVKINELLRVWKTIGRAPKSKNDEIWARFKSSLDKFFTEKKEFLSKIKEQQINNYNLKIDLCIRAEALQDSNEWGKTSRELINLQKEWKKIGPVPRKHSDKIWARFRAACDHFFNNKEEHFKNIHGVEEENLKLKEALIKEVEDFIVKDNKSENLTAVKDFQKRWIEIGHVPFSKKDKLHNKYKIAFEKLLDKLNINNIEISAQNFKNHAEMLKNSPDGTRKLSRERYGLTQKIKKLEDDILLWENNIGFFSHSKQSELLKQDFEKKIEKAKKELQIMTAKIKIIDKLV